MGGLPSKSPGAPYSRTFVLLQARGYFRRTIVRTMYYVGQYVVHSQYGPETTVNLRIVRSTQYGLFLGDYSR